MELHLTLVSGGGLGRREEIVVTADRGHPVADLATALEGHLGCVVSTVAVGDADLPGTHPLGAAPLLDGAVVSVDRPVVPAWRGRAAPPPLRLVVTAGPDAGRSHPLPPGRHDVGRAATIAVADPDLSRRHLSLDVAADGVRLRDGGSTNGTRLGGQLVPPDGLRVAADEVIRAGSTEMRVQVPVVRPAAVTRPGDGTIRVNRSARVRPAPPAVAVELSRPPEVPERRALPWVAMLVPLPVCAVLALMLGPQLLLFGLMSPLMMLASAWSDRWGRRRHHRVAHAAHVQEMAEVRGRIARAVALERRDREHRFPDAATVLANVITPGDRLWERGPDRLDHLALRVGTGTQDAAITVTGHGARPPRLRETPVVLDLLAVGVLGVCGSPDLVNGVAAHLVGQVAALHSPGDVSLWVLLSRPEDLTDWAWARWLPHARPAGAAGPMEAGGAAGDPHAARVVVLDGRSPGSAARVLEPLVARLDAARARATAPTLSPGGSAGHRDVVVLVGAHGLRTHPVLRRVLAEGADAGIEVIALDREEAALPAECRAVLDLALTPATVTVAGGQRTEVVADAVGAWWAERLARGMAPLRDATPSAASALPTDAHLIDLLGLDPDDDAAIAAGWRTPPTTRVVIGADRDGPQAIDLIGEGPHALVGGTTGSGKSELLRTWVTSLAVANSPNEVTFVLVDYKGGSAFRECASLPHTVGLLTDLDAHGSRRALASLQAELVRRERLLAAAGATDIADLRRDHTAPPLPRLVVVIDEFRVLAQEQPDFLDGLVRIAAVGRSLGVHVILATQRPGGVVSADVKANVNLRIALRVRDRIDSDDVLEDSAAADLPEGLPGRALVRTGSSPLRPFHVARVSGHAGSRNDGGLAAVVVRRAGSPAPPPCEAEGPTDLARLTATMAAAAATLGLPAPHRPWLPPLPADLPLPGPAAPALATVPQDDPVAVPWCVTDEPAHQAQRTLVWSLTAHGHDAVVGSSGSGRSTALHTLAMSIGTHLPARAAHLQVISRTLSRLTQLPQVGSVVDPGDRALVRRLVRRLARDLDERRRALREAGHATLDDWWEAWRRSPAAPAPPPRLVLLVDGWEQLADGGALHERPIHEELLTLLRDGEAAGLRAVVAGDRSVLVGRISSVLATTFVLRLADPADVALTGLRRADLPDAQPPGRAIRSSDGIAVQFHRAASESEIQHVSLSATERPWSVAPLPRHIHLSALAPLDDGQIVLGLGGDELAPIAWDPRRHGAHFVVVGPPRSGRSTTLATITRELLRRGRPLAVVTGGRGPLADFAARNDVLSIGDDEAPLLAARRAHPDLAVVADDAELVPDGAVARVLSEIARLADGSGGLVVAATTTSELSVAHRGLAAQLARSRTGVLLCPARSSDGDPLGVRVAPSEHLPGRGVVVLAGEATPIQCALSEPPQSSSRDVASTSSTATTATSRIGAPQTHPMP
ncbi:FtsK/SpoIIIE domain-containing protein [Janibacter sp. G1551]|uniref:FtsK/SpoIIIE domain-containing protein n=1 Tax=Janibacter sp. G1551 TaxID=3420440 RepID=UPI003D07B810